VKEATQTGPTFSVIIAAYQAAGFVAGAVRSALDQDPSPLEIIVGDDESTDDLAAALAPFGAAVRVIRIEHGGEAAAKNAAAAGAVGDFLAFLDADDRFLPGRLAAVGALARSQPDLDVITTDAHLVTAGRVVGRAYGPGFRFEPDRQREAILRGNFVLGNAAVRRSRFAAVGGFDPAVEYTTDWDLWVRLVLAGSKVGFIDEPLAEYHLHPTSMSARRADMSRGRLETLARAAAREDLTAAERVILEETWTKEQARLAREELKEALAVSSARGARRAAVRILRSREQPPNAKAKALAALVAPALLSRGLRRVSKRSFTTVGDRRVDR
jgi:cellulose synthase/poly-beta-1,6-N-acetylglucosamine synthase-like glycosyltransferase